MINLNLDGKWKMKEVNSSEWLDAIVPGSVYMDLMENNKMDDPFYRDNEDRSLQLCEVDYEYTCEFLVEKELLACDKVLLYFEGLDTLARIKINGHFVSDTNNMHRIYEFDIKGLLKEGENSIHIVFFSSVRFIAEKQKVNSLWGASDALQGFPHIRKAHSMFGWDWGPKLPDAGIWRSVGLKGIKTVRLIDVNFHQLHEINGVTLNVEIHLEAYDSVQLQMNLEITPPNGEKYSSYHLMESTVFNQVTIQIENPELWWPAGYGKQPLYEVKVVLSQNAEIIDTKKYKLGLRTLIVRREKDQWGESFAFEVNKIPIFIRGANYIPEDNLLSRCTIERTDQLLSDCIEANFNSVRIWGGGIYPSDDFYDLCDKYGLIVWQDFMFACGVYEFTEEFAENIKHELIDNIRRLRHHASLALWCGNNEMEMGWEFWDFPKTKQGRVDYIKQFEIWFPQILKKYDPDRLYWPSSPSSRGGFDQPNDENCGDVHYWAVWHDLKPFTDFRKFYFRFCSEFGFQSFPSLKTVNTFTLPEDRNIFSYVMEKHQKNGAANGKILYYLSETFKYPKDFASLLYASQILQAEAIRYGVEHWRRHRGRCMGAVYWQLNDCWPVASWASIDYFGRWKALHYAAKRFYAPILLSACDEGTQVDLFVTNDTLESIQGMIHWSLRNHRGQVLKHGMLKVEVPRLEAMNCVSLDFSDYLTRIEERNTYLEYNFEIEGEEVGEGTVLFTNPKHFEWLDPCIEIEVNERSEEYLITFSAKNFAKYVGLDLELADCKFSDNYFDLSVGKTKIVTVKKQSLSCPMELEKFIAELQVRSVFDMA
ncbi:MAG: csxA [Bacilli bacterium]|nr:csxA [Bacilli bacterium]